MNKALVDAGNPPEGMIIQSGEMHGFYDEKNSLNLYTEMLAFFRRHIGGKVDVGTPENANCPQAAGSRITGSPLRLKLNVFGRGPLHTQADCVITHPSPQTSVATEQTSQPLDRKSTRLNYSHKSAT